MEASLFFCYECKKEIHAIEDILVVEDSQKLSFCSNECISSFFSILKKKYKRCNELFRKKLGLEYEEIQKLSLNQKVIENTYSHIKNKNTLDSGLNLNVTWLFGEFDYQNEAIYSIMATLEYNLEPTIILFHTVTKNKRLKDNFFNNRIDDILNKEIPTEMIEEVERKKSNYLALLFKNIKKSDISFEDYPNYEKYGQETLTEPDEIYKIIDDEGDEIYSYIKTFEINETSFYYIFLVLPYQYDEDQDKLLILPIISFPSLDPSLYSMFTSSDLLHGSLRN